MHRIATKLLTATIALVFLADGALSVQAQQSTTAPRRSRSTQSRGTTKKPTTRRPATKRPAPKVQQAAAVGRQRRPRKNAVLKAQKLPPTMLKFLKDWEINTANHNRLMAKLAIFELDDVFYTEQRGIGEIKFEAPDKCSLKVTPMNVKGQQSTKLKPDGKPYTLSGMSPQRWVCTGKEIFQIDDKEKTFRVVLIPPNMQGKRINEGPIPFLFGLKAEEAQKRYRFYQLEPQRKIDNSFWFLAKPLRQVDRQEYKTASVILNHERFVPIAIRLTGPSGKSQKTYHFKDVKVNPQNGFLNLRRSPFIEPDIKGYKLVGNGAGIAPPPGGVAPAGRKPAAGNPRAQRPQAGRVRITDGQKADRK